MANNTADSTRLPLSVHNRFTKTLTGEKLDRDTDRRTGKARHRQWPEGFASDEVLLRLSL